MENLAITVLGNRNSGKSTTWNQLFEGKVKTGKKIRKLYLREREYVHVFLVSGSPEERESYVGNIIGEQKPRIVLCSMQYRADVTQTIQFFSDNNYFIFSQWLNPGYFDPNETPTPDDLELMKYLLSLHSIVGIRNGKSEVAPRINEIRDFIYGWASSRNLIIKE
ncbi:MAG: hypothetical protein LCH81_05740 [Bacteroidetes bacterium]|nr:hypothetical protein [Bacteroidota bacterium]